MNGVTYYTQWQWPGLMWRVDAELCLVEVATAAQPDTWALSQMDRSHVDAMVARKEMTEVPAP